jgi:hypothetical protein
MLFGGCCLPRAEQNRRGVKLADVSLIFSLLKQVQAGGNRRKKEKPTTETR